MSKQPLCRICKKRPPWKYKNCPPGICKRCYHKHVWPERPAARKQRRRLAGEAAEPEREEGLREPTGGRGWRTPYRLRDETR